MCVTFKIFLGQKWIHQQYGRWSVVTWANVRFEVLTAVKISMLVFWVVMPCGLVACRLVVVMGQDFVLALRPVACCTIPGWKRMWPSEWDRLGLTPNLMTRDLWRSRRWARGNENFVYLSLWDFKSSFTCRKILWNGTFPLYFSSKRNVCCGFLSSLKIHRLVRVRTPKLWVQWQAH
jgi:hypothetical protein